MISDDISAQSSGIFCIEIMARFIHITFLVVCLIALTLAYPGKDIKDVKKEAAKKKACMQNCDSVEYKPICAGKDGTKSLSFGSVCVMNNYNCDKNESLKKLSDGECPGGGGIRLS